MEWIFYQSPEQFEQDIKALPFIDKHPLLRCTKRIGMVLDPNEYAWAEDQDSVIPFPEDIIQWLSFAPTDPMLAINKSVTDDIKEQLAFFSLDCAIMTVPEIIITQYFNYFYPILTDYICILTQKEAPSLLVHVKHGKFKNTMSLPQTQSLSHDMLTNLFDLKTSINIITNKKSLCPNMTLHEASKDIKSYTNLTTALQGMLDELKV